MTNNDDNSQADIVATEISARYRASAVETTTAELDRKILRQASAEVRGGSSVAWGLSWLRPATFVATLGLTMALLLEFGQFERLAPANTSQMPGQIATLDTESLPANKRNADGNAFKSAADATARQVRDVDASADVTLREMPRAENFAGSADVTLQETPATEGAAEAALPVAAELVSDTATEQPRCSDTQRQKPADWRLCIADLRNNGFQDAAEHEVEEFQRAFPDYVAQ